MDVALPGGTDHPSWMAAVGTLLAYGLILLAMAVALFLVPYLFFVSL